MKNGLLYIFLLLIIATSSQSVFSQRRGGEEGEGQGTIPQVTLHPTITHATCFNPTGEINYYIEVANGWVKGTKINRLDLFDGNWENPISLTDNGCCGTISNLSPGMYTFYGSMTVVTSTGMLVSVLINQSVWLGIETVWTEKIDMISSPNSYSAKRNAATVDYGGVRSSNGIASGDGWIEMSAVYGSTSDNRVFLLIGETNPLGTFDPASDIQYVEFYEGSSGSGIKIKYETSGGSFTTASISGDHKDKIRLVRVGSTLTIQKNNSSSTVFSLPVAYTGAMNIVVRTLAQDDGCLDVVSTFPCEEPKMYANLKYKLDGFHHIMKDGKIRFMFDQEYDTNDLKFTIYNHIDLPVKVEGDFPALTATNGDNYLIIDVSDDAHCIGRGFFYLEVTNSKKEKSYLRFFNDFSLPLGCIDYIDNNGNPSND